ncbi:ribose-5-phosphate isomerase A [Spirochaetia bacterium]|nr:ribose-5-phosphate isomerase A [Spirochaetia bacterium]GHU37568.1 ribose-5-phosphate isomerase A [Spirochaetia bacterium]
MTQQEIKEQTGKTAVESLIKTGMKIGLGTGSTVIYVIRHTGYLLRQGLIKDIRAVTTSFQSLLECESWGIPAFSLNSPEIHGSLDLTIDGADEVDKQGRCVKGGGGALLLEKIAAYNSAAYALVVDESKIVEHLGRGFPVPVEVIPEARVPVTQALERLGMEVKLREAVRKAGPVITEHANMLLDCRLKENMDPAELELNINLIPGVVENGFFTRIRPVIFEGHPDGSVEQIHAAG